MAVLKFMSKFKVMFEALFKYFLYYSLFFIYRSDISKFGYF